MSSGRVISVGAVLLIGASTLLINGAALAVDGDGDGVDDPQDCQPANLHLWSAPSEAQSLRLVGRAPITLTWIPPAVPGGDVPVRYDVLRSTTPGGFGGAACIASGVTATTAVDPAAPASAFYLVRALQGCGGTLGTNSSGVPTSGIGCGSCPDETCNGADDDCSGIADDHLTPPTGLCATQGVCAGQTIPVNCTGPSGWRCNYSGVASVELDGSGSLLAAELRCDSRDGNCNGVVDLDGFASLGQACSAGVGACQRSGTLVCNTAQTATTCNAVPGAPTTEVCNDLDDNCDGATDNGAFGDGWEPNESCTALRILPTVGSDQTQTQGALTIFPSGDSDFFQFTASETDSTCACCDGFCTQEDYRLRVTLTVPACAGSYQLCSDVNCATVTAHCIVVSAGTSASIELPLDGACPAVDTYTAYVRIRGNSPPGYECRPYTLQYFLDALVCN